MKSPFVCLCLAKSPLNLSFFWFNHKVYVKKCTLHAMKSLNRLHVSRSKLEQTLRLSGHVMQGILEMMDSETTSERGAQHKTTRPAKMIVKDVEGIKYVFLISDAGMQLVWKPSNG
jgi:hypothetical protein